MRRRQLTATLAVVLAAVFVLGLPLLVVSYRSVADNARAGLLREAEAAAALVTYRIEQGQLTQDAVHRMAPQVQRERDMVGDISHQIRSRLTALSMRLEEVAASDDPHVRTEALAALDQADRLSGVVDELLAQAREKRAEAAERLDVATELATLR